MRVSVLKARNSGPGTNRAGTSFRLMSAMIIVVTSIFMFAAPAFAAVPQILNIFPTTGPVGTPVIIAGTGFGAEGEFSAVLFNGVSAEVTTWQENVIAATVPEGATTGPVTVVNADGVSNGVEFTVTETPVADTTWYLAEGSTAWGFETYILMQNITDIDATVNVTYNTEQYGRLPRPQALNVPPNSRVTFCVNDDISNVDVSTELDSSQPIVCERSMYWNSRIDGHDSIGVTDTANTWYLSEGYTDNGFETWVLIQNPSQQLAATVNVTYMTSKGTVEKAPFQVGAGQRYTINVAEDVGACEVSTQVDSDLGVICERSMYWDGRRGGHETIGVTQPGQDWYLAEGSTAWGFDTWLLLQNPGDSEATVDVTYMTPEGPQEQPTFEMEPNSRHTVHVNDYVVNSDTSIGVASSEDIIAERAMYWNNGTGRAGHDTRGLTEPSDTVYLAEGSTAWGFETFVCMQNPNDEIARVQVTYNINNGAVDGGEWIIQPNSRVTINVNQQLPNYDTSIKLESDVPIAAERAMYWNTRGGGHDSIGWSP
ncbi:MAG: IPT/TIG domain-containing protein [Actinobacteria bacterium]|nr:IPT/TIG domain-containing protein [Actinomycetota bacterium]